MRNKERERWEIVDGSFSAVWAAAPPPPSRCLPPFSPPSLILPDLSPARSLASLRPAPLLPPPTSEEEEEEEETRQRKSGCASSKPCLLPAHSLIVTVTVPASHDEAHDRDRDGSACG